MLRALSFVGLLAMIGAAVGMFATGNLFSAAPAVIAAQVAAGALMVWARVTFGLRSFHATADPTEGGLVTSGPYSTIRHPIYTLVCLFVWAGALAHLSPLSGALAALEFADSLVRMIAEECMLIVRYPEYREYATRPKRMIPFIF
jgi:protein-S-isoprenylcysteine O-methyltransferase Ste14